MGTKFKSCFVPSCNNNSKNSNKIFIHLPNNKNLADSWFLAVGRPVQKNVIGYYCCEDHFMLEDDCENWIAFTLMRNKIKMKNTVVPHKNLTENQMNQQYSQLTDSAKKRKRETLENYSKLKLEECTSALPASAYVVCIGVSALYVEKDAPTKVRHLEKDVIPSPYLPSKNKCNTVADQAKLKRQLARNSENFDKEVQDTQKHVKASIDDPEVENPQISVTNVKEEVLDDQQYMGIKQESIFITSVCLKEENNMWEEEHSQISLENIKDEPHEVTDYNHEENMNIKHESISVNSDYFQKKNDCGENGILKISPTKVKQETLEVTQVYMGMEHKPIFITSECPKEENDEWGDKHSQISLSSYKEETTEVVDETLWSSALDENDEVKASDFFVIENDSINIKEDIDLFNCETSSQSNLPISSNCSTHSELQVSKKQLDKKKKILSSSYRRETTE